MLDIARVLVDRKESFNNSVIFRTSPLGAADFSLEWGRRDSSGWISSVFYSTRDCQRVGKCAIALILAFER